MKLKKITESINLVEEDEIIDPAKDSTEVIADKLKDEVETATDDEKTLSDAAATTTATEIKTTADEVGAVSAVVVDDESDSLDTDNRVTRALNRAYAAAKFEQKVSKNGKMKANANVLICGLPGSGKTASVYDWANSTKGHEKINIFYVNAKNGDLDAYINGFTVRDANDPEHVKNAYSSNLDPLDRPNSVLFLDEFNRQTNNQIRAALLTLVQEHAVSGTGAEGRRFFKNMLFTIAAINPAVPTDQGASELIDAEKSRFIYKIKHMNSTPEAAIEFFNKSFDQRIKDWLSREDVKDDPEYLQVLETLLREQDLGIFIASHPSFRFDTEEDLDELADTQATMWNQRGLTDAMGASKGDVDYLINEWVPDESDLLEKDQEMLLDILKEYARDIPSFETLCKKKGIELDKDGRASKATADKSVDKEEESDPFSSTGADDETVDDDADMWAHGARATTGGIRAKTPIDARAAMLDKLKSFSD